MKKGAEKTLPSIEINVRREGGDTYQGENRRDNTWKTLEDQERGTKEMTERITNEIRSAVEEALRSKTDLNIKLFGGSDSNHPQPGICDTPKTTAQILQHAILKLTIEEVSREEQKLQERYRRHLLN